MIRLTVRDKKWHQIHARNILNRRHRRKSKKHKASPPKKRVNIVFPYKFSFDSDSYRASIRAINNFREAAYRNKAVFIDMSGCRVVTLDACLVLASEIERCTKTTNSEIWGAHSNDVSVSTFLNEFGFYKLIKVVSPEKRKHYNSHYRILPMTSGEVVGFAGEGATESLRRGVASMISSKSRILSALDEAMENCLRYAYKQDDATESHILPYWWRAGCLNNESGLASIVFYDQGLSIPRTIRQSASWHRIIDALKTALKKTPADYQLVSEAISVGKSSTQKEHHGKGLQRMRNVIENIGQGTLHIYSRRAYYGFSMPGNKVVAHDLNEAIKGTLILWIAPSNEGKNEN